MKTAIVFMLIVGVAVAQLGGAPAPGNAGVASAAGGAATGNRPVNPYGPRVYGMGLNNPWALPPSPFVMQRALALLNTVPGALLRVDVDGDITFTNQFGQEVDIVDNFGNELSEHFE